MRCYHCHGQIHPGREHVVYIELKIPNIQYYLRAGEGEISFHRKCFEEIAGDEYVIAIEKSIPPEKYQRPLPTPPMQPPPPIIPKSPAEIKYEQKQRQYLRRLKQEQTEREELDKLRERIAKGELKIP